MTTQSLKIRLVALAVIWTAAAILVAGLLISTLLRQFVERNFDASLSATMVAVMAGTEFDQSGNLVISNTVVDPRYDQPLSGWYWQLNDANEILARSRSLWDVDLGIDVAEPDGSILTANETGPNGAMVRRMQRDFTAPGGTQRLRVIIAMPADVIDDEVASIVQPLVISLVLLVVAIAAAIGLQVHYGLAPLARLGRNIVAVRRGDRETIPEESYAEIRPITTELNALIAHNRSMIERTRMHVGNLAHGLKTPLSIIGGRIQRDDIDADGTLRDATETMNRLIRHHLRRARTAAAHGVIGARTPVEEAVADLLPVFRGIYAEKAIEIEADVAQDLRFSGDRQDLDEMLGNLIDNACKWATARVEIAANPEGVDMLEVRICDDGPGMDEVEIEAARSRGVRFDEAKPGSGLGLSIVDDLAMLHGGKLTLSQRGGGGLVATLLLPRAG
jgi:signal transduction histidine kinase